MNAPATRSGSGQVITVLAVGLLLAILLVVGIAYRHGSFSKQSTVYVIADSAAGIVPGTTVRLSGLRVGEVAGLALQPDHTVKVTMKIGEEYFEILRADVRADLIKEQLVPAVVEIHPGVSDKPIDPADPKMSFHRRNTLTEIAEDLRRRIAPILDDAKHITTMVRSQQGQIEAIFANAAKASHDLAGSAAEVRTLTVGVRKQVATLGSQAQGILAKGDESVGKIGGLMTKVDQSLTSVNSSLATVNSALPGLLQKADDTLTQVNAITRDARGITSTAADTVPGLLRGAPPLMDETREIIQGVRRSWLVRSLTPPPPSADLPIETDDAKALREPKFY